MQYVSHVIWQRNEKLFTPKTYDRTHTIKFNGGFSIEASSAPEFLGNAELPNPEELFISSIASCLMLTFLYLAAMKSLSIEEVKMRAVGTLAKNAEGKLAVTEVVLHPEIAFTNDIRPEKELLQQLFDKSHEQCFISSSVKSNVIIKHAE